MQNQYPARVGVLIFNENDIKKCIEWNNENINNNDKPCPVSKIIENKKIDIKDLKNIPVSTQAIHRLLSKLIVELSMSPGASSAYIEYFFT